MSRIKLTTLRLQDLRVPEKGQKYYYDSQTPTLAVCVSSAGTKTFYRCGRVYGKYERIRIGRYPTITLAAARKVAIDISGKIAEGKNPQGDRRKMRKTHTIADLFEWYLENHSKKHKSTWKRDESRFNKYLEKWSSRKLHEVTREDVEEIHTQAGMRKDGGHYAANDLVELLRHMYSKAIEIGWHDHNPAAGIKRFPEPPRERFLTPEEMPRFFKALANIKRETTRDYLLMSLVTGARRSNVQAMRWDQIDFTNCLWLIPGDQFKSKRPLVIPFPQPAMEILHRRHENSDSEWVFPGGGKTGHIVEPKAAWQQIKKEAGCEDLRIHDLRHTFCSWLAISGVSLHEIAKLVGHSDTRSTQRYSHLLVEPLRRLVDHSVSQIISAGDSPETK